VNWKRPLVPRDGLKRFHEATREHWDRPQTLTEAWREMNAKSLAMIHINSARL
jgi:hypothetical protein